MTKTFYFCPEFVRTKEAMKRALSDLMRDIANGVTAAHIQRVTIANRVPVHMCCGESEIVFQVEYGIEEPAQITFEDRYQGRDAFGRLIAREFGRFGSEELKRLQSQRALVT